MLLLAFLTNKMSTIEKTHLFYVPHFAVLTCPDIEKPAHGFKYTGSNFDHREAKFGCHTGYVISGQKTLTCQSNGLWNGSVPSCTGKYRRCLLSVQMPL